MLNRSPFFNARRHKAPTPPRALLHCRPTLQRATLFKGSPRRFQKNALLAEPMFQFITNFLSSNKSGADTAAAIAPEMIDRNAREVVSTLQKAGFEAYVVGGCIRDILLGHKPKDFDVATNAAPWEVKPLFRRARVIGRRFQIVHAQFGREIIEITTFRAPADTQESGNSRHMKQSDSGMLTRDNVFGTMEEDALRRDFTVNALYYDPSSDTLYDFADGLEDIKRRTLRIIGDAATRYREDPVRMLRAVRFAAKLDFSIEKKTAAPIAKLAPMLGHISSSRLFDESLKLFLSGDGLATYQELRHYRLLDELVPGVISTEQDPTGHKLFELAFRNTDQRLAQGKSITPAFIWAALLWPQIAHTAAQLEASGQSTSMAVEEAANKVMSKQLSRTSIPRRFSQPMREIWEMQWRLPQRFGSRAERLVERQRFRAAYDFLLLREESGEQLDGLGEWWTRYQESDAEQRRQMVNLLGANGPRKKRRRRRPPRTKPDA